MRDSPVYRIGNFVFFFALEEKLWVWTFRICLIQIWYIGCATKGLYLLVSWEIDNTEAVVSEQAEGRVLQLEMHLLPVNINKQQNIYQKVRERHWHHFGNFGCELSDFAWYKIGYDGFATQLCLNWMCNSFNYAPFKCRWHAARSAIILKSFAFWFALIVVFCLQKSLM